MKYTCLILLWSLFATMALPADNLIQSISIVPCPESITPGTGYFTFSGKTDFTVENEEQAEVARCFSALFTQAAGSERESASYYRLYGNVENQYPASAFGG